MLITDIMWKEYFIEKIAEKHFVSVGEMEEALFSKPLIKKMSKGRVKGEDVYAALAQISGGRRLIVLFIDKKHGLALPISARDMDDSERRYYAKHR
ncbi:MAG: BrnT family toxin [Candidatus Sumerlaeota bacterium]|nr:BrnT family toxin [Candidatus Sumerlaeota bacterium]